MNVLNRVFSKLIPKKKDEYSSNIRLHSQSEYLDPSALQSKIALKTITAVAGFFFIFQFLGIIASIIGFQESNQPYLTPVNLFRTLLTVAYLYSFLVALKKKLKTARTVIIITVMASLVFTLLNEKSPVVSSFLVDFTVGIITLQVVSLVSHSVRKRIAAAVYVVAVLLVLAMRYYQRASGSHLAELTVAMYIMLFLFLAVLVSNILGAAERTRMMSILGSIAYFDGVTGLPNVHSLVSSLAESLHKNLNEERPQVVLGLHIEGMVRVIHKHGYLTGDQLLRDAGNALRKGLANYSIYRLRGPDYAIVPNFQWEPDHLHRDEMLKAVRSIMQALGERQKEYLSISATVVGTIAPEDGTSATKLIRNLHSVIAGLKPVQLQREIVWFNPEQYRNMERQYYIEDAVHGALKFQQFHIEIQPKYHFGDDNIHDGEILARWNHPNLGPISPIEFIPVLERTNLMVPFTRLIIKEGERLKEILPEERVPKLTLAVNFSASTIGDPEMISAIEDFMGSCRSIRLQIEITEDVFVVFDQKLSEALQRLKAAGATIALDDFGTGFSNLSYLQKIEADVLKIDRQFISPLPGDSSSIEMVKAIITMAHAFNLKVVAEGVETAEQISLLKEMGCDIIQGYFLSKPLPVNDFFRFSADFRAPEEWRKK